MIVLPNYDNQNFNDIMETAKHRIPVIYPQWTDMNSHDPGITMLELFAWLKEMQQYHLNRITAKSYESMLSLLGYQVEGAKPATTPLVMNIDKRMEIHKGRVFTTTSGISFESKESKEIGRYNIKDIFVFDGAIFKDVIGNITEPGIHCKAFGRNPVEGESAIYINMNTLEKDSEYRLFFKIFDSYPYRRNAYGADSEAPREIVWEYSAIDEGNSVFKPVKLLDDKTNHFSISGELSFSLDKEPAPISIGENLPLGFWLRGRLMRRGCEENPRIETVYANTFETVQQETLCETIQFICEDTEKPIEVILPNWLGLCGKHAVLMRDGDGWNVQTSFEKEVINQGSGEFMRLKILHPTTELIHDGNENLRVVCYKDFFESSMVLSGSNGLPGQTFPFSCDDSIICEKLTLMVYEENDEGKYRWQDWTFMRNMSHAGPYDRCFSYNNKEQYLYFGDNEHGAVPLAGDENIIITGCVVTKGALGNIDQQSFEAVEYDGELFAPFNPLPAIHGKDQEELPHTIGRFKESLRECVKAVTDKDYEVLAMSTPGLRLAGAKAIPFYDPDGMVAGEKKSPSTVTVVVLPYSEEKLPRPDARYLEAVERYLDKFRLITTRIKVTEPFYVKINIDIDLVVKDNQSFGLEDDVTRLLDDYFSLLRKGDGDKGPRFGEPVRESLLAMKLAQMPGIIQVSKLSLNAKQNEASRDNYGNIIIPRHGLPYLGEVRVRLIP